MVNYQSFKLNKFGGNNYGLHIKYIVSDKTFLQNTRKRFKGQGYGV